MKIAHVRSGSAAARAGLHAGDELLAVNGQPIRDSLDYLFAAATETLRLRVRPAGGAERTLTVRRKSGEDAGVVLPPDRVRRCSNRCIFCFIDQNPRGLRPALYVKDEDYRLSLFYGNYLTLTDLRPHEITRICAQRLSPLFVSVHATDPAVRRRLLGCAGDGAVLPLLRRLAAARIEFHAQVVIVPGYNDGAVLTTTLTDLEALHPALRSVAIVPVGLTRHRDGLVPLRRLSPADARRVIREVSARQERNLAAWGTRLHFLADEFYLLAGQVLPAAKTYERYPQIENGVGMVRRFEAALRRRRRILPRVREGQGYRRARRTGVVVSGMRFAPFLSAWLPPALAANGEASHWRVRVLPVRNHFYGTAVTTAGLLTGGDILSALRRALPFDVALLPPATLNDDGLMLDGMRPRDLALQLGRPVRVGFGGQLAPRT